MSLYERELKGILRGDEEVIAKVVKSLEENVKSAFYKIKKRPFVVVRAAGSFGIDLVAIRGALSFLIEVKTSKEELFHFSDSQRLKDQAENLKSLCARAGVIPLYAFRLKRAGEDPWRIFTFEIPELKGATSTLYQKIPKINKTQSGNYVMAWREGLAMHMFIEEVCRE